MQIVVMPYCLGNNDEGKSLYIFSTDEILLTYFWSAISWIQRCGTYGYGGLAVYTYIMYYFKKWLDVINGWPNSTWQLKLSFNQVSLFYKQRNTQNIFEWFISNFGDIKNAYQYQTLWRVEEYKLWQPVFKLYSV